MVELVWTLSPDKMESDTFYRDFYAESSTFSPYKFQSNYITFACYRDNILFQ